jgi:hypothetical protein
MDGLTGAPVHEGSWTYGGLKLPDFGITEWIQGQNTTTPSPTGLTYPTGEPFQQPNIGTSTPTDILGAFTSGGLTTGSGNPTPTPTPQPQGDTELTALKKIQNPNPVQIDRIRQLEEQLRNSATSSNQSTLNAIQNRLNEARRLAGEKRTQAKDNFDYLNKTIAERYPELLTRSEARRTSALGELDTQAKSTGDQYARADMQARRIAENAATDNRMAARAGNRLGSSFYNDIQGRNKENLATGLGASDLERISKLAAIGTRKSETGRYFDETDKDIENSKMDAEREAYTEYKNAVAIADQLDRAGVLDYGEGVAQAEQALQSRLGQIDSYVYSLEQQKLNFDNTVGAAGTPISAYQTTSPTLAGALGQTSGLNAAQNVTGATMNLPTTQATSPQFFGRTGPTLDELQRALQGGALTLN